MAPPGAISPASTLPSNSATIDCSGRTQVMVPLPHFIDLGQGSAFIAASMMPGRDSAVGPPFFFSTANQNSPLPVSRFSAWSSEARPAPFRKPWIAWSGAPTRGPRLSSLTSARAVGRPSTTRARRRGVTKARASPNAKPAAFRPSQTSRLRSSAARACMRAGISSLRSSRSSSAISGLDLARARGGLLLRHEPRLATRLGEIAHAQDVALPLGDADHAARVQKVETVRGFYALLVGRQRQLALDQPLAFLLRVGEVAEQHVGIGDLEIVGRLLLLVLQEDVAVGQRHFRIGAIERQVVDRLLVEEIHRQPLQPVGDLARHEVDLDAADLLEIGELADLRAIAPDFPAQAPGAERRALPIVLDEADVMQGRVDADCLQGAQIAFEDVGRRRLQDRLELVIVLQAHRVLAIAPVRGPARGLDIGCVPGLWAEGAQGRGGVKRAGTHLHVERLQDQAALAGPIFLQGEDEFLEARRLGAC